VYHVSLTVTGSVAYSVTFKNMVAFTVTVAVTVTNLENFTASVSFFDIFSNAKRNCKRKTITYSSHPQYEKKYISAVQ